MAKFTSEITEEEIKEAIRNCKWRQDFHGTDICAGNCNLCFKEIEAGRCDTLKRLVEKHTKEE